MDKVEEPIILVVDDNAEFRELVKVTLRRYLSCRILEATDGAEAMQILEATQVHIVVTDNNIPKMNGIELLSAIQDVRPDVPVHIMFSGLEGHPMTSNDMLKSGASTAVSKSNWKKILLPKLCQEIRLRLMFSAMLMAVRGTHQIKAE